MMSCDKFALGVFSNDFIVYTNPLHPETSINNLISEDVRLAGWAATKSRRLVQKMGAEESQRKQKGTKNKKI
jgi:hypothetical protein